MTQLYLYSFVDMLWTFDAKQYSMSPCCSCTHWVYSSTVCHHVVHTECAGNFTDEYIMYNFMLYRWWMLWVI